MSKEKSTTQELTGNRVTITFHRAHWRIPSVENAFSGWLEGKPSEEERREIIEKTLRDREAWEPSPEAWEQYEQVKDAVGKEIEVQLWDPIMNYFEDEGPSPFLALCDERRVQLNEEGKQQAYLEVNNLSCRTFLKGCTGEPKFKNGDQEGELLVSLAEIYTISWMDKAMDNMEGVMSPPTEFVKKQLRSWAGNKGINHENDYTPTLEANLFIRLSNATLEEFRKGDGGELTGKMRALHSSSALVCNVFDYWRDGSKSVLTKALNSSAITGIQFEKKFPTGLSGNPPNLDVVLTTSDNYIMAIESKFLESYGRHKTGFNLKYFESEEGRWDQYGFHKCQNLALQLQDEKQIPSDKKTFKWLHAEQLLKHILGLSKYTHNKPEKWCLIYLWYRVPGEIAEKHEKELQEFASIVEADGISFKSMTYQNLFLKMKSFVGEADREYLSYLKNRYFSSPAP